jgi:tripartite-type tricarboxylate transporter receptor subunit TctC
MMLIRRSAARLAIFLLLASQAEAQTVGEFYRGKALTIIVGNGPGGGFDVFAPARVGRRNGFSDRTKKLTRFPDSVSS